MSTTALEVFLVGVFATSVTALVFNMDLNKKDEQIMKLKDSIIRLHDEKDLLRKELDEIAAAAEAAEDHENYENEIQDLRQALKKQEREHHETEIYLVNTWVAILTGFLLVSGFIWVSILRSSPLLSPPRLPALCS